MSLANLLRGRVGRAFPRAPASLPRIGAEVEFLTLDAVTRQVAPFQTATLPAIRRHVLARGWRESVSAKGTPRFTAPHGGAITFEPGGQVEYATPPFPSPAALLADMRAVLGPLLEDVKCDGVELLAAGTDPFNGGDAASLQVDCERYRSMDGYFSALSPHGRRMMRQTASVQISVDPAGPPATVWRALNALAPYLTAIFANSAVYAGRRTSFASYRAETWRLLDPSRTGIWCTTGDPVDAYAERAARAPLMVPMTAAGSSGLDAALDTHLSTVFPEVRPRRYFEVRSVDAVPPAQYPAILLLIAAVAWDADTARELEVALGPPDEARLLTAGRAGLRDAELRAGAATMVELAVEAAKRLGPNWLGPESVASAHRFFSEYTLRGRMLSDDPLPASASEGASEGVPA